MMRNAEVKDHGSHIKPASPIIRKMRWPFPIIWIVPILAAVAAGIYFFERHQERGQQITIRFDDITGVTPGETPLRYHGVQIGKVDSVELASGNQPLAKIALQSSAHDFARVGAKFWVVKADVSEGNISGLGTIISGPYIDSAPGSGEPRSEFTALPHPPATLQDGLKITLHAPRLEHLQIDSPVYFRGIQVGAVQSCELSADANGVDAHVVVWRRYVDLVRSTSKFWVVKGVDIEGGLLSGAKVKVDSLRALFSGGVTFSTSNGSDESAADGAQFSLYDEPRKEWLDWSPKITLPALTQQDRAASEREKETKK